MGKEGRVRVDLAGSFDCRIFLFERLRLGYCANEAITWLVDQKSSVCMTFSLSCDGGFSFACRCIYMGFWNLKGDFLRVL